MAGTGAVIKRRLEVGFSVWVDNKYGNDTTGRLERRDLPFKTINAAWLAINAAPNGFYNMYIANGSYVVNTPLQTVSGHRYTLVCETNRGVFVEITANRLFEAAAGTSTLRYIDVHKGFWRRTSTSNTTMITGYATNKARLFDGIYEDINSTGAMIYRSCVDRAENCRFVSTIGRVFIGPGNGSSTFRAINCHFESISNDLFESNARNGMSFFDCTLISQTARAMFTNSSLNLNFRNCSISTFLFAFSGRPGMLMRFAGENLIAVGTNQPAIVFQVGAGTSNNFYQGPSRLFADTLTIRQPLGSTASPLNAQGHKVPLFITNKLILNTPLTPTDGGAIGITFNQGAATIGNVITMALPGAYRSGSSVQHTVTSTDIATNLLEMKALIDVQILTIGTPWNIWTSGDTSLAQITGNSFRIYASVDSPQGHKMRTNTTYITETGTDVANANVLTRGFYVATVSGEVVVESSDDVFYTVPGQRAIDYITPLNFLPNN